MIYSHTLNYYKYSFETRPDPGLEPGRDDEKIGKVMIWFDLADPTG
jgi:hypothetical protein